MPKATASAFSPAPVLLVRSRRVREGLPVVPQPCRVDKADPLRGGCQGCLITRDEAGRRAVWARIEARLGMA